MRSPAVRLALSAAALATFVGAAVFVTLTEQHIAATRSAAQAFDAVAHQASTDLAELRFAEAAYVAEGQGLDFWTKHAAAAGDDVARAVTSLQSMATTAAASLSLDDAATRATAFSAIDRRARDYVNAGSPLLAGDVIFSEGANAVSMMLGRIEAARAAEQEAADRAEHARRRMQAAAIGAAALVALVVISAIALIPGAAPAASAQPAPSSQPASDVQPAPAHNAKQDVTPGHVTARPAGPVLRAASRLCTDFGRVSDAEELRGIISRAADLMDASGLIVWLSASGGAELRPALSHGYSADVLARVGPLARSADNAAATAFRTGEMQIVLARPGSANGAIVAPVLAPGGCVGVLSAEIRGGGESSDSVQALAAIFAAQLASVVHSTPESHEQRATGT